MARELERRTSPNGVTLVGSFEGPVVFGFTERTGGVSAPPFSSLNLGAHVDDDSEAVAENRRRALEALGCAGVGERLIEPRQVHGDHVVVVDRADAQTLEAARAEAASGADAVVCTVPDVPVLLCFADCVPIVLTCERGFAVVHSGWRGTLAGIAGTAARALADAADTDPSEIYATIGPHITGAEYEVSDELIERFAARFPEAVEPNPQRLLDLSACIRVALAEAGVAPEHVCDSGLSTVRENDRFFSYRAEHGRCGRHGALAVMRG